MARSTPDGTGGIAAVRNDADLPVALTTLLDKAGNALQSNATFLAIGSPSNAQVLAQVQALTRQVNALLRLQTGTLDSTAGT